jgi:monoamine oxidase
MVYSTATSAAFWRGLGPNNAQTELSTADACRGLSNTQDDNARLRKNWRAYRAPAELVTEVHRQILALHGVQSAPEPLEAVSVNWSDDPFGGAVHLWNPGVRSWQATLDMTQPIEDLPCYVCGEAYSTMQTWVEGALSTADLVQQRLNLAGRVV